MIIKICGNTSLDDARVAAEAGADMLGFIFYDRSPRAITVANAASIIRELRGEFADDAPLMVGVFVDEPLRALRQIMADAALDAAQLHGSEPPVELRALAPNAFKALRPQNRGDAEALTATYAEALPNNPRLPDFLLDSYHPWKMGGTGQPMNVRIPLVLARRLRIMLAGGLTPDTVADAIQRIQPWGVDVASGVEAAPGVKDHGKVRAFVEAVHGE
ncbi:MAG: phosphoribosylanthranilate isomerase [Anaerolineales bacterium]|nr:phosphoribosylanthranilate isomerase [Anaerolineales bacterium]MCB9128676.1 phosphoribosylanthranilate isomerase [Ardenticatenales bacterium]